VFSNAFTQFNRVEVMITERGLTVVFRLTAQFRRRIEFHINFSVTSGNFIVTPGAVTMPLTADEKRTMYTECENKVFQRSGMTVVNQILQQTDITLIHLVFEFSERNPRGIDNSRFTAQMIDQSDPSLTIENFDVIFGRHIEMFHDKRLLFYLISKKRLFIGEYNTASAPVQEQMRNFFSVCVRSSPNNRIRRQRDTQI
jgi:hypothetical protein